MKAAALLLAAPLASCVVHPRASFPEVDRLARERGAGGLHWRTGGVEDRQVDEQLQQLLARPLNAASAARIAILNSPTLQGTYERLGVAQADLVQAGLLRNPSLSLGMGIPIGPGSYEYEGTLLLDFLNVFLIPLRKRLARNELEAVKLEVADAVLETLHEVRVAFYMVQAGQQTAALYREVLAAAQSAADLVRRQAEAGNVNDLDVIAELNQVTQAQIDLARAETQLTVDREHLTRVLGLWGRRTGWTITEPLPPPPPEEAPLEHAESFAISHRLDLGAARQRIQTTATSLSLAIAGLFGGLQAGAQVHQDPDAATRVIGPTLQLEIPIFDQQQAVRARLRAQLRQAELAVEALAIRIRSDVRAARQRVLAGRSTVEYYRSTVLPLRERFVALSQLQYNGMYIGLFSLLQAKQSQITAYREYIETVRDYWIARAGLERVAGGPMPLAAPGRPAQVVPPAPAAATPPDDPAAAAPAHHH